MGDPASLIPQALGDAPATGPRSPIARRGLSSPSAAPAGGSPAPPQRACSARCGFELGGDPNRWRLLLLLRVARGWAATRRRGHRPGRRASTRCRRPLLSSLAAAVAGCRPVEGGCRASLGKGSAAAAVAVAAAAPTGASPRPTRSAGRGPERSPSVVVSVACDWALPDRPPAWTAATCPTTRGESGRASLVRAPRRGTAGAQPGPRRPPGAPAVAGWPAVAATAAWAAAAAAGVTPRRTRR